MNRISVYIAIIFILVITYSTAMVNESYAGEETQTITANDLKLNVGKSVSIDATCSSGLPLTYVSFDTSVATVTSEGIVNGVKVGRTIISIIQPGDDVYESVRKDIVVTVEEAKHVHADVVKVTSVSMLICGGSRAVQLYKSGYNGYSYVGVSGGEWASNYKGYCKTIQSMDYRDRHIKVSYSRSRHKAIIDCIDRSLKKSHANKTILIASTNDIADNISDAQVKARARKLAKYARILRRSHKVKKRVKIKGKYVNKTYTYRNKVYVVRCTPTLGGVYATAHDTAVYNRELRKLARRYGYTYVHLRNAKNNEFISDGIHFKTGKVGYNKYMINTFLKLEY